ncbi:hypothetical protein CUMW_241780 [Citrus unshiu]|uniref:ABC-2 type transporter transmembrane domain-containing protein n=1 Tax=Citrus unshiu TaxID=55188 RepID=A0A2H5QLP3_CITUN|nr:hypothetical protein CUMW_241780 [Citrus unshiu]
MHVQLMATWMLEVSSKSAEAQLGVDLARIYRDSALYDGNQQNLFNIHGSLSAAVIFSGLINCTLVLPYVQTELTVMYWERFAGMYSPLAYALGQIIAEVPYIFFQTGIFIMVTYPMVEYYGSMYKIFCYFYMMFCSLLYYNYLGMLLMLLTPNYMVAAILSSAYHTMLNLFSGFFILEPRCQMSQRWLSFCSKMHHKVSLTRDQKEKNPDSRPITWSGILKSES